MRPRPGWRACVLLALSMAACEDGPRPAPSANRVAVLGDEEITYEQFEEYLDQQLGEAGRGLASDVLSRLFDQFLEEKMLTRLAIDRGLVPEGSGRRVSIDRLLAAEDIPEPTAEEIEQAYRDRRSDFERPERVRLRQILLSDRGAADAARKELLGGADFAAVARRYATDAGDAVAGPQGELARDELPPAFVDPIFRLAPGEISEVVEAEYGFHVFQVVERLPAETMSLADAQAELRDRFLRQRADERLAALAEEARNRYNVAIAERNLPFNYQRHPRASNP